MLNNHSFPTKLDWHNIYTNCNNVCLFYVHQSHSKFNNVIARFELKNITFKLWPSHNFFHNVYIICLMAVGISIHDPNYKNHYHVKHELEMIRNKVRATFQSCQKLLMCCHKNPRTSLHDIFQLPCWFCWNLVSKCATCSTTTSSSKKM